MFPGGADGYILVQVGIDGVRLIPIGAREIRIMKKNGWVFIEARGNAPFHWAQNITSLQLLTCVGFAKRATGIRDPFIWTPDGLYEKICTLERK
jgi:hypothetical protein